MSRGSAWAARRERAVASVEEPQQRLLAEWTDHGFRARTEWEDNRARRRAEFGVRITAIAAQVASDVSAAVASEVSAAVAAALQAARAGHHEYLDHAPTTTSTPTASLADDNASVPDASVVVSAQRLASAFTQQQQQQEEEDAPRQTIENRDASVLAAWMPTTCSTQCPSRAAIVSVLAPASAATPASSKVTASVVERYYVGLEPAASTSMPTTTLDVSGACSTAANSHTHNGISTTIIAAPGAVEAMAMDISMPTHTSILGDMYSVDASAATCSTASPGGDNATTLVSVAVEASTAIELAPSVAAPLVCLDDLHFKLYTGAIGVFQSVPMSASSRCSTKSLDQDTSMELPESAHGVCPPTRVACAYFQSSLMPLSAAVFRSARVQKVNMFQLLNNNDNISVTREQDKSPLTWSPTQNLFQRESASIIRLAPHDIVALLQYVQKCVSPPPALMYGHKKCSLLDQYLGHWRVFKSQRRLHKVIILQNFPYVGCLGSPWDPGQQAPISWFGVGGIFSSDPEKFQWVIAWLYFLVCSAVCNKYHGLASTEARKLNSILSCTDQLQWEIAWLLIEPSGAHSELGVSGNLTNMCHLFGSWGKLISMLSFIYSFYGTVFKPTRVFFQIQLPDSYGCAIITDYHSGQSVMLHELLLVWPSFSLIQIDDLCAAHMSSQNSPQPSANSGMMTGQCIQCTFKLHQWKIAWILDWDGYEHDSPYGCENLQWTIAWSLSSHFPVSSIQPQSACFHCGYDPMESTHSAAIHATSTSTSASCLLRESSYYFYPGSAMLRVRSCWFFEHFNWQIAWPVPSRDYVHVSCYNNHSSSVELQAWSSQLTCKNTNMIHPSVDVINENWLYWKCFSLEENFSSPQFVTRIMCVTSPGDHGLPRLMSIARGEFTSRYMQITYSKLAQVTGHFSSPDNPPATSDCIWTKDRGKIQWSLGIFLGLRNCRGMEHWTQESELDLRQIPVSQTKTSGASNIRMYIVCRPLHPCEEYFLDGRISTMSMITNGEAIKNVWAEGDNCAWLLSPEQFYTSLDGIMLFVWDLGDSTAVTAREFAPDRLARHIGANLQLTWNPCDFEMVLDSTLISKNLAVMPATSHGAKDDTVKGGMPVIWDPGGLTHCRLEDKPKFKGEGLSATFLSYGRWAVTLGPGLLERTRNSDYKYKERTAWRGGLDQKGFGLGLALRVLAVLLCLSRLCTVHLPPLISFFL